MLRARYGQTRWDRGLVKAQCVLSREEWDFSNAKEMGRKSCVPRAADFQGTALAPLFPYVESHLDEMLLPQWTFYWQFLFDNSFDAHMFGGIWPELLGTIYLTLGAMTFAIPLGVISAIYLTEYSAGGPPGADVADLHQHPGRRAQHRVRAVRPGVFHQYDPRLGLEERVGRFDDPGAVGAAGGGPRGRGGDPGGAARL